MAIIGAGLSTSTPTAVSRPAAQRPQQRPRSRPRGLAAAAEAPPAVRPAGGVALLALQQAAGNAAVTALLGRGTPHLAGQGHAKLRPAAPLRAQIKPRRLLPAGRPPAALAQPSARPPSPTAELVRSVVEEARARLEAAPGTLTPQAPKVLPGENAAASAATPAPPGPPAPPSPPASPGLPADSAEVAGGLALQRAAGVESAGSAELSGLDAEAERHAQRRNQLAAAFRVDADRQVQALASGSITEIMRLVGAGDASKAGLRAQSEGALATLDGEIEGHAAGFEAANAARQGTLLAGLEGQADAVRSAAATEQAAVGGAGMELQARVLAGGEGHASAIQQGGSGEARLAREQINAQAAQVSSAGGGGYGGGEKGKAQGEAAARTAANAAPVVAAAGPAVAREVEAGGAQAAGGLLGWVARLGATIKQAAAPFVDAIRRMADEALSSLRRLASAAVAALARLGGRVLAVLRDLARRFRAWVDRMIAAAEALIDRLIAAAVEELRAKTEEAAAKTRAKAEELAVAVEQAEGADPDELEGVLGEVRGGATAKVAESLAAVGAGVDRAIGQLGQHREQVGAELGGAAAEAGRSAGEDAAAGLAGQETLAGAATSAGASSQARSVAAAGGLTASFRGQGEGLAGTALGAIGGVAGQALGLLGRVAGEGVRRNRAEVTDKATGKVDQAAREVGDDHERSLASRVLDAVGKVVGGAWNAVAAVGRAVARAALAPLAWAAGAATGSLGELLQTRLAPLLAELGARASGRVTAEGLGADARAGLDLDGLTGGLPGRSRSGPVPGTTAAFAPAIPLIIIVALFLLLFLYWWIVIWIPFVRGKGFPKPKIGPAPPPTVKPVPKPTPKPTPKPDPKPKPTVDPPPPLPPLRCRDPFDPCPTPLPISWPRQLPLPVGADLVRSQSDVRDEDGLGGRGSAQRQMNEEIAEARRRRLPPPRPCDPAVELDDTRWNSPFDAHHIHPLFLGGIDTRGNLCALETDLHQRGHPLLANQPEHLDEYLACRICSANLFQHPRRQEYFIAGRKG